MRFLFVDRITALSPGTSIQGLKHVTADDYYLQPDNEGAWYFVPSLMGETLGQLAAWNVMMSHDFQLRPVAGIVSSARLHRPVYVGETIDLHAHIDSLDGVAVLYHGEARVRGEVVFQLEGALGPLLPMSEFIDESVVRRQFSEINRPLSSALAIIEPHEAYSLRIKQQEKRGVVAPTMVFDQIVEHEVGVKLVALKHVTRAATYFIDHFPNKPVLPMSILIACFLSLVDEFLRLAGIDFHCVTKTLRRIKMNDFVHPGDVVMGSVTLKRHASNALAFVCRADVDGKRVGLLEIILSAEELIA